MQATCAELRTQFGGNNERFSDCWLSQDEGRSWRRRPGQLAGAWAWQRCRAGPSCSPEGCGPVELLKGEVSRLRAEQQWLAISRIPRMPAAEGFSWPDGQNGQVSDHQRRGEAPQYPRQLHPVAEASEFATTRRFSKPTRRLITPEDFKKRDEVLRLFIKKSMGFRLNQLDTLSELSLNEDILRAFGESPLAEARPEAREPIQRRGVRRCKHPLGICSNQLRVQRLCRWVSSNGRVSHVTLGRACHM